MQNSGGTTLNGDYCKISAYCSVPNKVYQSLPSALPDQQWTAKTDFHIVGQNPSRSGTGGYVIALTAGDLDFMSEPTGPNSYVETNQDGLTVVLNSGIYDSYMGN